MSMRAAPATVYKASAPPTRDGTYRRGHDSKVREVAVGRDGLDGRKHARKPTSDCLVFGHIDDPGSIACVVDKSVIV